MSKRIVRITLFALACSLLFALTACTGSSSPAQPTPEPVATPAPASPENNIPNANIEVVEFTQADIDAFNEFWREFIPEAEGTFELSIDGRALYYEYILSGNLAVFEGVPPLMVLKVWLQAAIDGNFEREFFLIHPDSVQGLTLEEYLPPPGTSLEYIGTTETRQWWADLFFSGIQYSEVTIEGDRASVSFYTETGEHMTHWLRQNEDGIWLVELF